MRIVDNAVSNSFLEEFQEWNRRQPLLFGWKAKKEFAGKFWHKNYVLDGAFNNHYDKTALGDNTLTYQALLMQQTPMSVLAEHMSERFFGGLPLTRVWVNVQAFGDEGAVHADFPIEYRGRAQTVIWYPVGEWDIDWGGDFAVFDEQKEIAASVAVKPNRAVIFDGTRLHAARPMSRYCNELRVSVAFGREEL